MSIKLFVSEAEEESFKKLEELIAGHPEFELCKMAAESIRTKAGRVLDLGILFKRISDIFITVGITAKLQGYYFLRDAVPLAIREPDLINCITKQLYPSIAKQFKTSPSKVERAIRHAIEVSWTRGQIEQINEIFGVEAYSRRDRPTNGEFIAMIADRLLVLESD
jgi:two-component system response regulator (stage 0 sporulation protein A)